MRWRLGAVLVVLAALGLPSCLTAGTTRDVLIANLKAHVTYLASDSLEGRLVGTPGIEKAGDYIAREFEDLGLEPAFEGSYFQEFDIVLGFELVGEPLLSIAGADLSYSTDFAVLPISGSGSVSGTAMLCADSGEPMDHRVSLVLLDRGVEEQRWTMTGRDGLLDWMREVCERAARSGAVATVFVSGRPDDADAALHRFPLSRTHRPVDIPALEVNFGALKRALASRDISLENLVEKMITEDLATMEVSPLAECDVSVAVGPRSIKVRNIGGILRGAGPGYVVIGAHYDHLGYGDIASSTPWRREVHYGADDNASGVACVIEIARRLASQREPERSVVFLAFTAEELGALGSEYYCKHPPDPIDSTVAMINLDCVGRLEKEKLIVFGARSAEELSELLGEAGAGYDLEIIEKQEIYGFSDQNAFYARGVPSLHLFTGAHEDYHSPDDVWRKINFEGLASITSFAADFAALLVSNTVDLSPVVTEPPSGETASHGKGAYLGVVPDFAYAGTGVGIKGTVPKSPAEAAGLRDGDVIVGIDDEPIVDLRGLMTFLVSKSPGDRIRIQVMRGSLVQSVEATLSVRSPQAQSD